MKQLQIYDFAMAAGGSFQLPVSGNYFRIITATGNVSVTGDTFGKLGPINRGQGLENSLYNRLTIKDESGAPNAGTILVSDANFIDQTLYGSISLSGAVDISVESQNAIRRPEAPTSTSVSTTALAALTAVSVFAAGANPNGTILLAAQFSDNVSSGPALGGFIAKATTPANLADGDAVLIAPLSSPSNCSGILTIPQFIPAGLGLWAMALSASNGQQYRMARWKHL